MDTTGPVGGSFLTAAGQLALYVEKDPSKPTPCEDAIAVLRASRDCWVLVVADGVGGIPGGRAASELALKQLAAAIDEAHGESTRVRTAIIDGIERANQALLQMGTGAATTIAVVEIGTDFVRPYHVGDSGILLVGQRGRVKLQTVPHSPVGFAVEAGLLEEHEAIHHELLHVISNVIGTPEMRIEVGPEIPMAARDTLVVATDGLLDNMLAGEIIDTVRTGPLDKAMTTLRETVSRRMRHRPRPGVEPSKPDDCGILLFRRHTEASRRAFLALDPETIDWVAAVPEAVPG
jgi:serine/threonine protein phosphatase PrpC